MTKVARMLGQKCTILVDYNKAETTNGSTLEMATQRQVIYERRQGDGGGRIAGLQVVITKRNAQKLMTSCISELCIWKHLSW